MEIHTRRWTKRKISKRLVVFCFVLLLSSAVFAVTGSVDPNPVAQNSRFNISFELNNFKGEFFELVKPETDVFRIEGSPELSFFSTEDVLQAQLKIKLSCRALEPGIHIIEPFEFITSLGVFKSEKFVLKIGNYRRGEIFVPDRAVWGWSFDSLYVGESKPIYIGLENLLEIPLVDNIVVENPYKAILNETTNFGLIEKTEVDGYTLLNLPLLSYMVTPTSSGDMVLPRFRLNADSETLRGSSVSIPVKPIPSELDPTGAIGSFSYTYSIDNDRVYSDGRVSIVLIVSGEGNLSFLQVPEPLVEGLIFVDKIETMDIVPSKNGYTGTKTVQFIYVPDDVHKSTLTVQDFIWLDPKDEYSIQTQSGEVFQIDVMNRQRGEIIASKQKTLYKPKTIDEIVSFKKKSLFKTKYSYLMLLPGVVVLIFVIVRLIKSKLRKIRASQAVKTSIVILLLSFLAVGNSKLYADVADVLETALEASETEEVIDLAAIAKQEYLDNLQLGLEAYENGEFKKSCKFFKEGLDYAPDNAFLAFNLALASFQLGDPANAIFYAKHAIRKDLGNKEFMTFLHELEKEYNLNNQLGSNPIMNPDIFLIVLLVLINLFLIIFATWIFKRNNWLIAVNIILSLFIIASLSGFIISKNLVEDFIGISKEATVLYNIPDENSKQVLSLPPGTSVIILGESGLFYLVDTGYGLQGWINRKDLVR